MGFCVRWRVWRFVTKTDRSRQLWWTCLTVPVCLVSVELSPSSHSFSCVFWHTNRRTESPGWCAGRWGEHCTNQTFAKKNEKKKHFRTRLLSMKVSSVYVACVVLCSSLLKLFSEWGARTCRFLCMWRRRSTTASFQGKQNSVLWALRLNQNNFLDFVQCCLVLQLMFVRAAMNSDWCLKFQMVLPFSETYHLGALTLFWEGLNYGREPISTWNRGKQKDCLLVLTRAKAAVGTYFGIKINWTGLFAKILDQIYNRKFSSWHLEN